MILPLDNLYLGLLVFSRMSGLFFFVPFFSSSIIPRRIRFFLLFFVTLLLTSSLSESFSLPHDFETAFFLSSLVMEFLLGALIAFMVEVLLTSFQLAGQLISVQLGFGINEVIDPLSQISVPLLGQFQAVLGILVFIVLDGPGMVLSSMASSFGSIPPLGDTHLMFSAPGLLLKAMTHMFVIALKISFPILGTLFLSTVALGLMAKASPQMNVFMLGFPINISLGFIVFLLSLPMFIYIMTSVISGIPDAIGEYLSVIGGGE